MTQRLRRLSRLHAIRRVALAAAARRLSAATETSMVMISVARQVDQLRAGAAPVGSTGSGYALKSAAASASALEATAARLAIRGAEAEQRRVALAAEVQRQTAAADVIERVIERGVAEAVTPAEIQPRRKVRR